MTVVGNVVHDTFEDEDTGQTAGDIYETLICSKCEKPTIRSGFYHDGMDEDEWSPHILYPTKTKVLEGLPAKVQREYDAAQLVARVSPDAYAVLLGRILDVVCEDRGAKGKDLHSRLKDLAARQEIPERLVDMAHDIRQFRNVGAHANLGSLTEDEIPFLSALSDAVLEYVYLAPKMLAEAQARLDKIKGR